MANHIKLSASNIKYLLMIREVNISRGVVRSVDVAQMLKVTRPSVHAMLESMKRLGLLLKESRGVIKMTDEGKQLAESYAKYYAGINKYMSAVMKEDDDMLSVICAILAEVSEEKLPSLCERCWQKIGKA